VQFDPRGEWGSGFAIPLTKFVVHPSGGSIDALELTLAAESKQQARGAFKVQVLQLVDGKEVVVSTDDEVRSIEATDTVEILGFRVIEPELPLMVRLIPSRGKLAYALSLRVLITVYLLLDEAR
jgi:hypothetical protein